MSDTMPPRTSLRPVLRRIAIHGGLTAVLLAFVGLMLAELAAMWLAGSPGTRSANGEAVAATDASGEVTTTLRNRMPFSMALWGFVFVALGEVTLHFWRSRRPAPPQQQQHPDEAEKLLLDLLAKAEAVSHQETGDGKQETGAVPAAEAGSSPPATS